MLWLAYRSSTSSIADLQERRVVPDELIKIVGRKFPDKHKRLACAAGELDSLLPSLHWSLFDAVIQCGEQKSHSLVKCSVGIQAMVYSSTLAVGVSAGLQREIYLWQSMSTSPYGVLRGHSDSVMQLALVEQGSQASCTPCFKDFVGFYGR